MVRMMELYSKESKELDNLKSKVGFFKHFENEEKFNDWFDKMNTSVKINDKKVEKEVELNDKIKELMKLNEELTEENKRLDSLNEVLIEKNKSLVHQELIKERGLFKRKIHELETRKNESEAMYSDLLNKRANITIEKIDSFTKRGDVNIPPVVIDLESKLKKYRNILRDQHEFKDQKLEHIQIALGPLQKKNENLKKENDSLIEKCNQIIEGYEELEENSVPFDQYVDLTKKNDELNKQYNELTKKYQSSISMDSFNKLGEAAKRTEEENKILKRKCRELLKNKQNYQPYGNGKSDNKKLTFQNNVFQVEIKNHQLNKGNQKGNP